MKKTPLVLGSPALFRFWWYSISRAGGTAPADHAGSPPGQDQKNQLKVTTSLRGAKRRGNLPVRSRAIGQTGSAPKSVRQIGIWLTVAYLREAR